MSQKPHIADAEGSPFLVVNIDPDFCIVEGKIVPFDIMQQLDSEKAEYAESVHARGRHVLKVGSVILGTVGNAGEGIISGRSQGVGHCLVIEGDPTVRVEGQPTARHGHLVLMNTDD